MKLLEPWSCEDPDKDDAVAKNEWMNDTTPDLTNQLIRTPSSVEVGVLEQEMSKNKRYKKIYIPLYSISTVNGVIYSQTRNNLSVQ